MRFRGRYARPIFLLRCGTCGGLTHGLLALPRRGNEPGLHLLLVVQLLALPICANVSEPPPSRRVLQPGRLLFESCVVLPLWLPVGRVVQPIGPASSQLPIFMPFWLRLKVGFRACAWLMPYLRDQRRFPPTVGLSFLLQSFTAFSLQSALRYETS